MITVNIRYRGTGDSAHKFVQEMISSGTVTFIRNEKGNCGYEYFIPFENDGSVLLIDSWDNQSSLDAHHSSKAMSIILTLREKYNLHMEVSRYISDVNGIPENDKEFIRQ